MGMQFHQNKWKSLYLFGVLTGLSLFSGQAFAQVNTVEFGKNRLQFKNFKWKYYQTTNFNTYFSEGGQPLGKFVCQLAEKELPGIEAFVEYGLQRRANIVIYNSYNDLEQSNIGLNLDWQTTGGITKLVNNKMVVYYNGDHNNLRIQIRQGLARILLDNILFGDDLGEFAANQALLDLPQWMTDGYVEYAGETWSPALDDELKSAMLSGRYKNFYQFAFEKPNLAGHAFWFYLAEKYKKENVTYFLYLARVYRNLNNASQRICKKKFKEVLKDFMTEEEDKYEKDIRGRRNFPKGTVSVVENINDHLDFFHFSPNPAPRSQTYAVVEFKHGKYSVVLHENFIYTKVLLKSGVRSDAEQLDPHYPLLAWDPKGTRLAVVYWKEGKVRLFVYDVMARYKRVVQDLTDFDQIQDMKYMLDNNTLLLSAVRGGQSDIYTYKIEQEKFEQVTNDVFDDQDPSFVAFPGKTGIIYSSNRPTARANSGDTVMPSNNHYNVFMVTNGLTGEAKQISQLTFLKYGNARFPTQYNGNHFTFVSDENGISNRYAGFFTTQRAGIDTIYKIGEEFLHNPDPAELDSTMRAQHKTEPDTVYAISITNDSSYIFPITNYESGLTETKSAGDNGQVSEVRKEGDLKFLYKLKVDDAALKKRNLNARMTDYRKRTVAESMVQNAAVLAPQQRTLPDTTRKQPGGDFFESEFDKDRGDSIRNIRRTVNPFATASRPEPKEEPILKKAKLFDYKLKFSVDNFSAGFNNDVLITSLQPFTGSLPINLSGADAFSGMLKASIFDLFEDIRFTGAIRLPFFSTGSGATSVEPQGATSFTPGSSSFFDGSGEWFARVDYLKKRWDMSLIYYRETEVGRYSDTTLGSSVGYSGDFDAKSYTNLWQGVFKYPFDKVKSIRLMPGIRTDKIVVRPDGVNGPIIDTIALQAPPQNKQTYALMRVEYVYDNTLMKATNIWNGMRYKIYFDMNAQLNTTKGSGEGKYMYNLGFDARHYLPIFRNLIWAVRLAGDFSFGNHKVVYYVGGTDGGLFPKASQTPQPATDAGYAFQSLGVNLRGFNQNVSNGNNDLIFNSEFRLPVFTTLFNKPINNAFLRNFQLIQFFDLGNAWAGSIKNLSRPVEQYVNDQQGPFTNVTVNIPAGGIGPFAGSYGFGARSTLLGYFLRLDVGWEMNTFFGSKPIAQVSMGVDF
jgi:Tol biopolymer transport system component